MNELREGMWIQAVLVIVIGICVVLLLAALAIAYGPSGFLFGVVVVLLALALIVRRYRFSLKAFLLVTTVLGMWLGLKINRDAQMNRTLAGLSNVGGRFEVYDRSPDFPWGIWAHRYRLNFYGLEDALPDQDFSLLEALASSSLHGLDLSNTGITDEELTHIEDLTGLEYLSLANETYHSGERILDRPQNRITDEGLKRIHQLMSLKGIDLSGTDVTDDGLESLSAMPNLVWIYLSGTKIKGPGIAHLRQHKHLRILELNGCQILPVGYRELARLTNLSSIGLACSATTGEDLKCLAELTNLSILRLDDSNIDDDVIAEFASAHPNCKIEQ